MSKKPFNAAQRAAIDGAYIKGRQQSSMGGFIDDESQVFIQALPEAYEGQHEDEYSDFVDWASEQFLCGFAMARSEARHRQHAAHSCWPEVVRDVQKDLASDAAKAVANLVAVERDQTIGWWTILNEMRLRRELPDWVQRMGQDPGSEADHERWKRARIETDMAVTGLRPVFRYEVMDGRGYVLATGFDTLVGAEDETTRLRSRYPSAHPAAIRIDPSVLIAKI